MSGSELFEFERPRRRRAVVPNIVPILDMMTTIIFFLLLSTGFVQFTKLTVPPSKVEVTESKQVPPPRTPKLFVTENGERIRMTLQWAGTSPGAQSRDVERVRDANEQRKLLVGAARELAVAYHAKYAADRTLQVGMTRGIPYQSLIAVMDGVKEQMPDLVLISYKEAEVRKARQSL